MCSERIGRLLYTTELYEWNILHNVLSIETMARSIFNASFTIKSKGFISDTISINTNITWPDESNEEIWKAVLDITSREQMDINLCIAWCFLRQMTKENIERYQVLFTPSKIYISNLSWLTSQFIDDPNIMIYVKYILRR